MKKTVVTLFTIVACLIGSTPLKAKDMENNTLNERQQKIASIAVNTAIGNLDILDTQLVGGLEAGLTINEINEVLIQMYAYCGFPRSLQAINTFMSIINERQAKGIQDIRGEEPTAVIGNNKYQQGKETLEQLTHVHETAPAGANAFAPGIDVFLKEHLFADIFGRGILSYSERELATVSALIGLGGVDPMLQSHLNMAINTGLSEKQLREAIETVRTFVGGEKADNAVRLLDKVIENRK